ncbi:MAG: tetratricopeptide repeat protein [Rhodocyclaceae bacterium]|nr:tetratricopeptide repeat protein [Rhodocyclaceae bacterium]
MSENNNVDYPGIVNLIWHRQLDFSQLLNYASQLEGVGLNGLVAVLYQTWLKRNDTPYTPFAWFNLGALLFSEGDTEGAGEAYEKALERLPGFVQPRFNLGLVRERQGRLDEAAEHWRLVEQHASAENPDERAVLLAALNNLGRMQERRKEYGEALAALERSLALDPTQTDVLHHWIFVRARQCLWPVYSPPAGVDPELMRASTSALALLSLSDDPEKQLATARRYAARKIPADLPALAPAKGYGHERIRIGYCSSDFCLHPVSMLTVELFELHDREKFEIYGFCWSPEDGSALRQRVVSAFDHYVKIGELNEEASARLIREHEIDILIDLHGQTSGARMNMLAMRPAPIQITYLGLPATTGIPGIDYVIADRFLIPEEYAGYYSEKPIYLPDVYQASDRKRLCAPAPTRKACGLPAKGFVFCSFNNNYKYTSEVFTAWMNILRRVPGSVLWLLSDNPWAEVNLRREAEARGIDPGRLFFAERAAPENYLARYALPGLFLDTFPFNAGTTANDALWMGLPVLTLSGRAFASRMAGALLTAAALPELITYDLKAYEDKAVELATTRGACLRLRKRLEAVRENGVLFDMPRLVRNLEKELLGLAEGLKAEGSR